MRRRRAVRHRPMYEMTYNLFVTPGYKPSGLRAKNINTIDEVPDSSWFTNRIGTTRSRPTSLRAAPTSARRPIRRSGSDQREDLGRASRASPRRTRRARPGSSSSIRRSSRKARQGPSAIATEDLLGARLQPGRIVPDHVRSEERRDRSKGDGASSVRQADAVHRDDMNAILEQGRAQRRRHLSRRRRPAASRQDPRRFPLRRARVPTIPTTSFRTSIAASCGRCASSARGRTSPTSRRRTRSTRSSPRTAADRQALSAGRRLDVRHVQRPCTSGI